MLLCVAARPLGCDELGLIVALESWHRNFAQIEAPFSIEKTLLRLCPNLFKIGLDGLVHFVHLSLKDFLLGQLLRMDLGIAHAFIAQKCLRYLSLEDFQSDVASDLRPPQRAACSLLDRYPFYDYCSFYLQYHMEKISRNSRLWIKYSQIVQNRSVFYAVVSTKHHIHAADFGPLVFHGETPLRHVLRMDALDLVKVFVQSGYDIDEVVTTYPITSEQYNHRYLHWSTALHRYVENTRIVTLLLELGANPSIRDSLGCTSLHLAIAKGKDEVVEILLSSPKIDVNIQDFRGETPLHYQATKGAFPSLLADKTCEHKPTEQFRCRPLSTVCNLGRSEDFSNLLGKTQE